MIPDILPDNKHLLYFYDPDCECDLIFVNIINSPPRFFLLVERNYDENLEWCKDYSKKLYNAILPYSQFALQFYSEDFDPFMSPEFFSNQFSPESAKYTNGNFFFGVTREERLKNFNEKIIFKDYSPSPTITFKIARNRDYSFDYDSLWEIKRIPKEEKEIKIEWDKNKAKVTLTFLQGMYRPYIYTPILNIARQTFCVEKLYNQEPENTEKNVYTLKIKDRLNWYVEQRIWGRDIAMGSLVVNCEDETVKKQIEDQIPEELLYKNLNRLLNNHYRIDDRLNNIPYMNMRNQTIGYKRFSLLQEGFLINAYPLDEKLKDFRNLQNLERNNPVYAPSFVYQEYARVIVDTLVIKKRPSVYLGVRELNFSDTGKEGIEVTDVEPITNNVITLPTTSQSTTSFWGTVATGDAHFWIDYPALRLFFRISTPSSLDGRIRRAPTVGFAFVFTISRDSSSYFDNASVIYPESEWIDYQYETSGDEHIGVYGMWHKLNNFVLVNWFLPTFQNFDLTNIKNELRQLDIQGLLNNSPSKEQRRENEARIFQPYFDWMEGGFDPDQNIPPFFSEEMQEFVLKIDKLTPDSVLETPRFWLEQIEDSILTNFGIPNPNSAVSLITYGYQFVGLPSYNYGIESLKEKIDQLPFFGLGLRNNLREIYHFIINFMATLIEMLYEQQEQIKEIHACLGAGEFAYQDNGIDDPSPAYMHIARKVDYIAKALGIHFDLSGEILSVRQSKHLNRGDTIPAGWYLGQFGRNTGANTDPNAQKGGLADEERLGIVYEVKGNRFETNQASGNEEITQGGYILCESIPQLWHIMLQDLDRSLGLQTLGSIAIANPNYNPDYSGNNEDIKTPYWTYNGLGQLLLDLMYLEADTNRHAAQANVGSLKAQAVAGECLAALGVPATEKSVLMRVDDNLQSVKYPAFNASGQTIVDLLLWALQNIAIQNEG